MRSADFKTHFRWPYYAHYISRRNPVNSRSISSVDQFHVDAAMQCGSATSDKNNIGSSFSLAMVEPANRDCFKWNHHQCQHVEHNRTHFSTMDLDFQISFYHNDNRTTS